MNGTGSQESGKNALGNAQWHQNTSGVIEYEKNERTDSPCRKIFVFSVSGVSINLHARVIGSIT